MFLFFDSLLSLRLYHSSERLKPLSQNFHNGSSKQICLKSARKCYAWPYPNPKRGPADCCKRFIKKLVYFFGSFQKCVNDSARDICVLQIPSYTLSLLFKNWCLKLRNIKYFVDFVGGKFRPQHFSLNFLGKKVATKKHLSLKQFTAQVPNTKTESNKAKAGRRFEDRKFYTAIIVGDPHIKTVEGNIYKLPEEWTFVNLFFNRQYEISITAECGLIECFQQRPVGKANCSVPCWETRPESSSNKKEPLIFCGVNNSHADNMTKQRQTNMVDGEYFSPSSDTFPIHIRENNYFKKIKIQYKNEFLILCPDTFDILKRSSNCSHIRILCFQDASNINRGIFSLRYKKFYPRHQNMKYIKISIASLLYFEILSDTSTDERHEINVKIFFDDLSNTFGALINQSEFNKVDCLD